MTAPLMKGPTTPVVTYVTAGLMVGFLVVAVLCLFGLVSLG
jgi:hypothetical protein